MEFVIDTCVRDKDVKIFWANASSPGLAKLCFIYVQGLEKFYQIVKISVDGKIPNLGYE